MVKKIKNNKIIKRALIFISVLVVLCTTLALPVLAQAPSIEMNVIPSASRNTVQFYCYKDNNLCLIVYGQNNTSQVVQSGTIVFTEYYYNNFYTGNLDNDLLNFDNIIFDSVFVTRLNGTQSFVSASVANSNLYDVAISRGFDDYTFDRMFIKSYNNQFLYWEEQIIPVTEAYDRGYTNALNDYNAFEKGLFAIFNAPFVFVQNIVGFEIFGITLTEVLVFILILCIGYIILRFIGGALPL